MREIETNVNELRKVCDSWAAINGTDQMDFAAAVMVLAMDLLDEIECPWCRAARISGVRDVLDLIETGKVTLGHQH
jgi:hypothetical protein